MENLRKKIARLFIIGFEGVSIDTAHPIVKNLREGLGGVILFDRLLAKGLQENNISSPQQLQTLTQSLQEIADGRLLVAVDQEGGKVSRLKAARGFSTTPSALDLALQPGNAAVAAAARQTARQLASLGCNINFAPVVDLASFDDNPIIGRLGRSFSADPLRVIDLARTWIKQHQEAGVISCLKHFPGHGSSRADSHLGFVDITKTWDKSELEPYRQLIGEGVVEMVMAGHLYHRQLDHHLPATLSPQVINGLLRQELGFNGVVISDDLQMGAITERYRLEEACILALTAGVDLLIIGNNLSHDPGILDRLLTGILEAVKDGRLPEARIEEAWQRVTALRKNLANVPE